MQECRNARMQKCTSCPCALLHSCIPALTMEPLLTAHVREPKSFTLDFYLQHEGYEGLKKALAMTPDQVIEAVKASGLRGRGGEDQTPSPPRFLGPSGRAAVGALRSIGSARTESVEDALDDACAAPATAMTASARSLSDRPGPTSASEA